MIRLWMIMQIRIFVHKTKKMEPTCTVDLSFKYYNYSLTYSILDRFCPFASYMPLVLLCIFKILINT